ncbi:MAG: 3-dehydroquinate synthase [Candidatus Gottesmanbacteria bacterium GW2011_GWA2_44_17]|uniref:3-dehydroquinate synthase n=1 Tax=Candidatus Gottesmanbacteria bacterium GW2011_GWA2_44_17 TaxID=1618444 RepID=A0A0G1KJC6_9BACT|nr:MAG: 3-dehydroquinate synthase [Candidatus Gottesmanbacteria bacterium GW2011_GWA2_44_17]
MFIGDNLLSKINQLFDFSQFSKIAVLTDENIPKSLVNKVEKSLKRELIKIIILPGENKKNIETVKKIWETIFKNGFDRRSLLINLGGGVIGDMGGFAAVTFMRGIEFLNIPTTLLAQVDASVGGKTGIDFQGIKNGIGVFKDPVGVVIDVDTLKTLPKRELIKIIKQSIKIKLNIVKKDSKEKDLRKVLNFGHTIGHAIESLSWKTDKPLLHGEAVAIGMVAESKLASLLGLLSDKDFKKIKNSLINAGLPVNIKNIKSKNIKKIILSDKKNSHGTINWSLPKKIGKVLINVKAREDLVIKAIESIII